MANVAYLPIVLLEQVNALLEYFNREFNFMEIMLKISGIMLNSFTPSLFPKLFGHNSRMPEVNKIEITKKMTGKFLRVIDSC